MRSPTSTTSRCPRSNGWPTARCGSVGSTPIDEVSEELGTELPDAEWDTVGGLILNLLGHVPEEGEVVRFENLEFRTERVQGRRIGSVRITRLDPTTAPTTHRVAARCRRPRQ